jgi:class 3 adenylate cyclase/tetratricopeptide (TPR) repeat protein
MTFEEIVDQSIDMVKRRGQVSYRMLKRQFDLDETSLDDLKYELVEIHQMAVDQDGKMLLWTGDAEAASASVPNPKPPPISYTPQYLTEKILTSRSALEGERKQVTVLFADIKDSTELIRDLDPEEAQKLLDPAIHIMMTAVHRFEGTVNQVLGDGIMSLFGAPIAHEDHAARACYAALAMQAAMRDYTEAVRRHQGLELRIRVGLHSGEVVVRTIGNDLHMDYSAVGQTTHLAARMEQLATPGSIRLSTSTLRLVEGLIQVQALGPIPVKGLTDPMDVFELTGASTIRRRLQAAVARGLTTFVGRDAEIAALHHALEQAGQGQGQLVAAVGEPGVGKSRLVYEFVHSHCMQEWLALESASVSYGKAAPYFPVVDLLKRYVHVEEHDAPRTVRAKVTGHILTLDASLQDTIPALFSLLHVLPEDSPFLQLDPPQRRQRTLDALKRILLRESQVQPLLLVFEDLHWIDSETQALLDSLVESLPTAQLLLLVSYRPEYQHGWDSKPCYTQLRLDPLAPESADTLLEILLGSDPSLKPLKTLFIERTEGNPFFLEESVRTLVETQVLVGEPGGYCLTQDLPTIQVPPTVQAVLAARMDRLPQDEKRLLQTAAVIGTEVPLTLLQAIAELRDEALHPGLTHLQAAEFLDETSLFPERIYTFKHALTHEVVYGSLLQERRRMLHAQIVAAIEWLHADRLTEQIERLAYHAFRGEVWDKALAYCRQAGARAEDCLAYREAVACYEQALVALGHLPERHDTLEQAIDLRFDLRNALLPLNELAQLFNHLCTAEPLAERLGDDQRLGRIASYLFIYFMNIGERDRAIVAAHRALALATTTDAFDVQVATQTQLGQLYWNEGDFQQGLDIARRAMVSLTGEWRYAHFGLVVLPAVLSRGYMAGCLAELGSFAEAASVAEEAVRIAEAAEKPISIACALMYVGSVYCRQGDVHHAIPVLERGLMLCTTANFSRFFLGTASNLSAAYVLAGRTTEALPLLDQMLERIASVSRGFPSRFAVSVSETCLLVGRVDEASALVGRLFERSHTHIGRGNQAHACHLLGEVAAHQAPPAIESAIQHYQQALTLADELGMRPLQAHCHRGLGALYSQTGQSEQVRAELSTAIAMYRDMEMTFWLPETEAALTKVGSRR